MCQTKPWCGCVVWIVAACLSALSPVAGQERQATNAERLAKGRAEVYKTVPKAKLGMKSACKETACYIIGSYGEVNEEAVWHSDFSVMP